MSCGYCRKHKVKVDAVDEGCPSCESEEIAQREYLETVRRDNEFMIAAMIGIAKEEFMLEVFDAFWESKDLTKAKEKFADSVIKIMDKYGMTTEIDDSQTLRIGNDWGTL